MEAGVVVGADVVLGDAGDDEAVGADLVNLIVADIGDMFLAASPLPCAGPQALEFFFLIGRIDIALGVDILAAEKFVALAGDPAGRFHLVAGDNILRAL